MDKKLTSVDLRHSFHIEDLFNEFVESIGGELVSKLISSSPNFDNADYFFRKDSTIIELKCLQNDFLIQPDFNEKIQKIYFEWTKKEPISPLSIFHPTQLPENIKQQITKLHREPIRRIIKKANRQLRETAAYFKKPNARKLLLIASDGLYSLEPRTLILIICDILLKEFSSIDGFVFFTLNRYVDIPDNKYACELWIPCYSDNACETDIDQFVNNLGRKWADFIAEKIGGFDWREENDDPSFLIRTTYIK